MLNNFPISKMCSCLLIVFIGVTSLVAQDVSSANAQGTSAEENRTATLFPTVKAPVSVNSVKPGDQEKVSLQITNTSDKTISRLVVRVCLLGQDGKVLDDYHHSIDRWFGDEFRSGLPARKSFTLNVDRSHIPEGTVTISGLAKATRWEDGSEWPELLQRFAKQEDAPLSFRIRGVVGHGNLASPIIEFFNHSERTVNKLEYQIFYRDKDGSVIKQSTRMRLTGMDANKGLVHVGQTGIPKNTSKAQLSLNYVIFADGERWVSEKSR